MDNNTGRKKEMTGLILAGGRGTRLRPHTEEIPKPLLEVGGKAILEHQIETLFENGISQIIIITGFLENSIKSFIEQKFSGKQIQCVHNKDFETSRPAYGLIQALPFINEDTIYLNGDVFYDPKILSLVISQEGSATAIQKTPWDEEEVNVVINNNFVTVLSKNLTEKESSGEFIGVTKLSKEFINSLKEIISREGTEVFRHSFAIDLLNHVIHTTVNKIKAIDVTDHKAIEIDTPEDLENARDKFKIHE